MQGRHRVSRRVRAVALTGVAVTFLSAAAFWVGGRLTAARAPAEIRLTVGAAAEIAPAVRTAADRWAGGDTGLGRRVVVDVVAEDPADVAAVVAARHGVTLAGLGGPRGGVRVPDVWVPDSTLWPERLRAAAPGFRPTGGLTIASSPVVLARAAGKRSPTWDAVVRRMLDPGPAATGVVDPVRDAAGLSGLLALTGAARGLGPRRAEPATTATLRVLAQGRTARRADLLGRFPSTMDQAVLSEQAVIAYDAESPDVPLTVSYPTPAAAALDYPFLVMPGVSADTARAADGLRTVLTGDRFRGSLARWGLRGPGGVAGAGFRYPGASVPTAAATQSPPVPAVDEALTAWLTLTRPGRILTVLDISGSMAEKVPTAGGRTREEVVVDAAASAVGRFDDASAFGLWVFAADLGDGDDHRELVPVSPLSTVRAEATRKLAAVRPDSNGETGLYDTVLAAYGTMLADWDPGRINTVLILTGGDNRDSDGVSLTGLLTKLKRLRDPARPVEMAFVTVGPGVNPSPLRQITAVTGGDVLAAPDPAGVDTALLKILSLYDS